VTASDDLELMRRALTLAEAAGAAGEVPIAAVLVANGEIVAEAANAPIASNDPTAHAEILVLRRAGARLGNYRLPGTTLYVTLEPCPMCASALVHARVERVVFAAHDLKAGAAGSLMNLVADPRLNHRLDVAAGLLADESAALLQRFFRARR
jgi:tRNA(adenine34) deaminase